MALVLIFAVSIGGMVIFARRYIKAADGTDYQKLIESGLVTFFIPLLGGLVVLFFSEELIRSSVTEIISDSRFSDDRESVRSLISIAVKLSGILFVAMGGLGLFSLLFQPKVPPFIKGKRKP